MTAVADRFLERLDLVRAQGLGALVPDFAALWAEYRRDPTTIGPVERGFMLGLADGTLVLSVLIVLILQFVTAPYGRHTGLKSLFGPDVPGRLAWLLQEVPVLVVAGALVFTSANPAVLGHAANQVLLGMLLLHYANRALIYPLQMKGAKPTPFFVFFMAFAWCTVNGYMHGRWFGNIKTYDDTWLTHPQFLLGAALFLFGFLANIQADSILRGLRRPGDTGYHIPRGGLFEYVTAANYTAETVEWLGYMIATDFAFPSVAFFVFTVANLMPRALSNHKWYLDKFKGEYPAGRRAYIPFLL